MLASTDKNKEVFMEYGKDFMKVKLNSDDNLPLNKILKLHNLTLIVRSVFSRRQQVLF